MNWELEFRRCLEKRWLIEMPEARALVDKEIQAARDDLAEAKASYARQGYKWSTIQAYYAMFHACRALLYHFGYREKSHYCLSVAMRHLLVSRGLLEEHMVNDMDDARALREEADYHTSFSESGARHNLHAAERLVERAGVLLASWKEG